MLKKLRTCGSLSQTLYLNHHARFRVGNELIERVNVFKLLGVSFQNNLKWNAHVEEITRKANKRLYHLRECRKSQLPVEVGIITYQSKI